MSGSVAELMRRPARRWLPRPTVRLRLTALYGGLFLLTVATLLAVIYLLVANGNRRQTVQVSAHVPRSTAAAGGQSGGVSTEANGAGQVVGSGSQSFTVRSGGVVLGSFGGPGGLGKVSNIAQAAIGAQQQRDRNQLLMWSAVALAVVAIASIVIGWLVAGRVLAPLRTMTARTRRMSADSLDARLAVSGPDDELKELADTIDGLLERLDRAFDAQRAFVANASHELRTPLTFERAMLEVALADPNPSIESLRDTCQRVLAAGAEQERLIAALLDLARSQRGLDHREPVPLHEVVARVLNATPVADGVSVTTALEPARTSGDARLIERLVANLLNNALQHNVPGGWVRVDTTTENGQAVLRIANSGPRIEPSEVDGLIEPFRRADARLSHRGHGLGLSIVAAIATAHDAELGVRAPELGGLEVEVTFRPVPSRPVPDRSRSETPRDAPAELEVAP